MRAVPVTPRQVMFTVCGQCPSLHAEGLMLIVTAELQTAKSAYLQRIIQLSKFAAYSDGLPSQLIRISGVLLHT